MNLLYCFGLIISFTKLVHGACTWPYGLTNTEWYDGVEGTIMFDTSTTMTGFWFTVKKSDGTTHEYTQWECLSTDDLEEKGYLIVRSKETFQKFKTDFRGYMCLHLTRITDSSYRYYVYTSVDTFDTFTEQERIQGSPTDPTTNLVCLEELLDKRPADSEYGLWISTANPIGSKVDCPYVTLGDYSFSHTTVNTGAEVPCTGKALDMCTDTSQMTFDTCKSDVANSVSPTIWCVDNVPVGDTYYVTVYNGNDADADIDDSTVYRFSCLAISADGTRVSVAPRRCGETATATMALTLVESCITCPAVTAPSGGGVTFSTDGAVTTASYTCTDQYSLAGPQTRICQTNHTWTDENPTCTCILPSSIADGTMSVSTDGTTLTYSCNVGFVLVGSQTRECQTGNSWSGSDPTCNPCEELTATSGLNVHLTSIGVTSTVTFTCDPYYTMDGQDAATCLTSGSWDVSEPTCVSCSSLTAISISTGNLTVATDGLTTTATYSCPDGYVVTGESTLTCGTDGNWSAETSDCVCDPPRAVDGGSFEVSGDGLTVTFTCGAGYTMDGTSEITCDTEGGGWQFSYPNCSKCEDLTDPASGSLQLSTDGTETTAQYLCSVGYSLSGGGTATCQPDGTWSTSSEAPICQSCDDLSQLSVTAGNVTLSTNGTATFATYNCPAGYQVKGSPILTCGADGRWDSGPSDCVCEDPPVPTGGNFTLASNGLSVTFTCDGGYTMTGTQTISCDTDGGGWAINYPNCTKCENLTTPASGDVTLVTDGTQTTALYTCSVGSSLDGDSQPTCTEDGTWTAQSPSCVTCPVLSTISISTAYINLTTDGLATTATYVCPDGYVVSGETTLTCGTDGAWSAGTSDCLCDAPLVPTNGSMWANGSHAEFECEAGFNLLGSPEVTCQTDGSGWSSPSPECKSCSTVPTITDGIVTVSTDGLISSAEYACDVGHTMTGTSVLTCDTSGVWSGNSPSCVKCDDLVTLQSGNAIQETNGHITTVMYSCAEGYYMTGDNTSVCQSGGTWTNPTPICSCQSAEAPANGYIKSDDGAEVTYGCDVNYTLTGDSVRMCSDNGTGWMGTEPACAQCAQLLDLTDGYFTLSTDGLQTYADYFCDVGYTISGAVVSYCQQDGQWSSVAPTCVQCPDLEVPASGNFTLSTDGKTTRASFTCADGYDLVGAPTSTCRKDRIWIDDVPTCACTTPAAPENGAVNADGQTITYTCDVGYTMTGNDSGVCGSDGSGWSVETPSCVQCTPLTNLTYGSISYTSDGQTTVATFSCDAGSTLSGLTTFSCDTSGAWEFEEPECVSCPALPALSVSTGNVTVTSDGEVTTATYQCPDGYVVSGDTNLTCGADGVWSTEPSDCVCEPPTIVEGGAFLISADGLTVTFSCDAGFTMVGTSEIACDANGAGWEIVYPNCTMCETVPTVSSGSVELATDGTQTTAQYLCGVGFSLSGGYTLVCQEDGTWTTSGTTPACVSCGALTDISVSTGNVTLSTNGSQSVANYNCPDGYKVKGASTLTCGPNGTWDAEPSDCVCADPPTPTGGEFTLAEDGFSVTFTCEAGYTMTGAQIISCDTEGGGWAAAYPNCSKCEDLASPTSGNVSLVTDGSQTTAVYTCSVGSSLDGQSQPSCTEDGTWTAVSPTCVTCPQLLNVAISTASINISSDGVTTTATYVCPDGYVVSGEETLTCGTDGTWSAPASDCVCDTPPVSTGGNVASSIDGLSATFTCGEGYTISGTSVLECATDGSGWSTDAPNCTKCDDLGSPTAGYSTVETNGTHTTVVYSCGIGYSLSGTGAAECQLDGTWTTSETPTCVACPSLPPVSVTSGDVILTTNGSTTLATYTCPSGYQVQGETVLTCVADGTWSAEPSDCVCETPTAPDGGAFNVTDDGLSVTFSCGAGYTMSGTPTFGCDTGGNGWNFEYPNCTKCEDLTLPTSGDVTLVTDSQQTTAVYTCNVGSTLNGDSTPTCQEDGTWTADSPTCATCASLPMVTHSGTSTSTNGTHTIASYTCDVGTTLAGTATLVCLSDGMWSPSPPECVECPALTNENGDVSASTDGLTTTVTFTCSDGYVLKDTGLTSTNVTCGTSGVWSEIPVCVCVDPHPLTDGSVQTDGLVAMYSCDVGYSLEGQRLIECGSSGQGWLESPPTCSECQSLTSPTDGSFTFSSNGTVTVATFTCDVGTTLNGNTSTTCSGAGVWTGSVPQCVKCASLPIPANGEYVMSTTGEVTSVQLQCSDGYQASGFTSVECGPDGTWQFDQLSSCESVGGSDGEGGGSSLLAPLIAVSVISIIIIAVLSGLLAYFYRKNSIQLRNAQYSFNKFSDPSYYRMDKVEDFPIPLERATTSMAPVNHQHHVMEKRVIMATSPAPSAVVKKPVKPKSRDPQSSTSTDIETHRSGESVISFKRSKTSLTQKSLASISGIEIGSQPTTPSPRGLLTPPSNPNRLSPLVNHKAMLGKLPTTSPKAGRSGVPRLDLDGRSSPRPTTPVRCNTPISHALRVSDLEDKAEASVSAVGN